MKKGNKKNEQLAVSNDQRKTSYLIEILTVLFATCSLLFCII
jgi:hypothetical protein